MRILRIVSALALACAASCCLMPVAQAQYTVKKLVFQNPGPYTQQQLEAVADLKPGIKIGTKEMGEAAQRLMDTGAFKDLETTVDGPSTGISVVFKLKPDNPATFLPVRYVNLVWFTDDERESGLRQRVPLYTGRIPAAGTMQTSIQTALNQMLAAKGVTTNIETEQRSTSSDNPSPVVVFQAATPVVLQNIRLAGITADFTQNETIVARALVGKPYTAGSDAELTSVLLRPMRNAGYIEARIDGLQHTPSAIENNRATVIISGTVVPGEPVHVGNIRWDGTPIFSTADFTRTVKLHPGDIASAYQLEETIRPITEAYLSRGYMDAVIVPTFTLDKTTHIADYWIQVTPGEVYRVGNISAAGLSPQDRARFDADWKLKPGDIYDGTYWAKFTNKDTKPAWLAPYNGALGASADPAKHTVDLTLTFAGAK